MDYVRKQRSSSGYLLFKTGVGRDFDLLRGLSLIDNRIISTRLTVCSDGWITERFSQ